MIKVMKGHEPDRRELGGGSCGLADMVRAALLMALGGEHSSMLDHAAIESRRTAWARKDGTCLG